jgi:hypothetical protein
MRNAHSYRIDTVRFTPHRFAVALLMVVLLLLMCAAFVAT